MCCLLWCVNIYLSVESLFCLNVLYGDWLGLLIYCIYVSIIIKGFGVSYILCMDEVLCIGLRGDGDWWFMVDDWKSFWKLIIWSRWSGELVDMVDIMDDDLG